jgi:hypothetical protein
MYAEKRRHARASKSFQVTVRRAAGLRDEGEPVPARLVDVSLGGIGFATPETLRIGARIRVHLDVEAMGESSTYVVHIASWAIVRWCRPHANSEDGFLVGAEFVDKSPAMTELWSGFFQKWTERHF